MKKRVHVVITGVVQGVCFRYYTRQESNKLGITGWVRNKNDGTVEVLAEGGEGKLAELIEWLKRGPSGASVSDIREEYSKPTGEFEHFVITHGND